jgi:hypothetical protein
MMRERIARLERQHDPKTAIRTFKPRRGGPPRRTRRRRARYDGDGDLRVARIGKASAISGRAPACQVTGGRYAGDGGSRHISDLVDPKRLRPFVGDK